MAGINDTYTTSQWNRKVAADNAAKSRGTTGTAMSYTDAISALAERLAPGGEVESSMFSSIDKEALRLANQMEGSNISKGLGNATMGVAPTVTRLGMEQKQNVRNDLLGQYLSTLQFLVNAQQQQQSLDNQTISAANSRTTNAQRGLDAFGRPMSGTLAEAELLLAQAQLNQASNPTSVAPNSSSYPSLYSAGGAGVEFDFGDNPFATSYGSSATPSYDPWAPLTGYGELSTGESVGALTAEMAKYYY